MNNIFSKLFVTASLALLANNASAQCGATDCFIKGDFVEVGISKSGAFGACNAPAGYHPNGIPGSTTLGFVSDPDKDGWGVSAPGRTAYMGDYFVPGSPYEAWDVQFNGTKYSSNNCPSGNTLGGSTSFGNISYTATATEQTSVWQGSIGDLTITQTTTVKKDRLYFVMFVDMINTGTTTINGLYYQRALDPDNEQPWTGDFSTINRVVFQPNAISKNCLVTANGLVYPNSYLGLGTKDCRAKCYSLNGGLSSAALLSNIYNQNGAAASYLYNVGSSITSDVGYGLVFNLGNLAPGQKTSLAYTYILKQADLDSALGETAPKLESEGLPFSPYSTFRVCPGKTVPLKIIKGGQYKWVWTTPGAPHYMTPSGASTLIPVGGTIPALTGTTVYPNGAVYGDSLVVSVNGPRTYTAMGISNCDTQYLVFYVDTLNFTVPPAVTTPVRYCEGETASALTAGTAAGAKLNWYSTATGGSSLTAAPVPSTAFPSGKPTNFDTTGYWVSQTNVAGCETPRARIDVIVTRKPDAPVTVNLGYCLGDVTKILHAVGKNLSWYDVATGGAPLPSAPTPSSAIAGTFTYYVTEKENGCESDREPLIVEISEAIADFTPPKDSLCGSELLTLDNKSKTTSAGTYTSLWQFGDGVASTDSNTSHSYADARGTYTISLAIVNTQGCKDSISKIVEVFPQPEISLTGSADTICQGETVDFTGTATPGYRSLTWDFGDNDPSFNTLNVRHAFITPGLFNISLKGTYPACEGVGSGVSVTVIPVPNVNLGPDTAFCPGGSALILRNLNTTVPVEKYLWNTGDTSETINVTTAGQYSVRAQNWKCYAADSLTVTKACYLDIPNAFAPGSGSDYTNYFLPRDLLSKSAVTFKMQIFDRWGQLIFESDKVNGRGWDGNFKGQAMPTGVYIYTIRVSFANGVSESYNGNVTLVR